MIKDLPIGIQDIEKLLKGNYLYIDKTKYLYSLIESSGYYFLSRPRRFGKSLLISTLEAIFAGKRELFKNLWIEQSEYDWQKYPIIRIDFATLYNKIPGELEEGLKRKVIEIGNDYKVELVRNIPLPEMFNNLLKTLHKKTDKKVVVLIDEYDKALIDNITNPEIAKENRDILKSLYGILKPADEFLRFVLITGVSKFSKVSVFSDLNNLNDISMAADYAGLLGCTQEELEYYFKEHIKLLISKDDDEKKIKARIREWYNGYRFSTEALKVYNPFSLLLLFEHKEFKNYWFETATPSFLINLIKEKDYEIKKLEDEEVSELAFSSYEIENLEVLPLLFQTGYLTIKDYNKERMLYRLWYPNFEVEQAFLNYLAAGYSQVETARVDSYLWKCIDCLEEGDIHTFLETLKIFFANIPYEIHLKYKKYYQSIFYTILKLMGLKVEVEVSTNKGRIDAVVELEKRVYIFEFKLHDTAENALKQIKEHKYYEKYAGIDKKIVLVGVTFNQKMRNIGQYVTDEQ
ncbi:MAG: AAA family ATPase [bacterium]